MREEGLETEQEGKVADGEEIRGMAKIALHQAIHGYAVMTFAFLKVAQIGSETAPLDCLQLLMHRAQIRREGELTAVVEDHVVGWVDTL